MYQLYNALREGETPLHEAGVGDADWEALLPDVDGLQHPSMPQLGRHAVHVEDTGQLAVDGTMCLSRQKEPRCGLSQI